MKRVHRQLQPLPRTGRLIFLQEQPNFWSLILISEPYYKTSKTFTIKYYYSICLKLEDNRQ